MTYPSDTSIYQRITKHIIIYIYNVAILQQLNHITLEDYIESPQIVLGCNTIVQPVQQGKGFEIKSPQGTETK